MEPVSDFETAFFADHLVMVVILVALGLQYLLHGLTERMSRWHIALPGLVAAVIWGGAGWLIGGYAGIATAVLGFAASMAMAVIDERIRQARDAETHHERPLRCG